MSRASSVTACASLFEPREVLALRHWRSVLKAHLADKQGLQEHIHRELGPAELVVGQVAALVEVAQGFAD
jgi:hypothetical protein